MSKHLEIKDTADINERKMYSVNSKHTRDLLGSIYYYSEWKEYVFYPNDNTIWSLSCMQEIIEFIKGIKN